MPFSPIPPNLSTSQYQQLVLELLNTIGGPGSLDIQPPILSTADFRHLVLYALNYIAQQGGSPSGAAGGDLAGTYPNPTIKSSVALSGTPTAPTAAATTNTLQIASTAFVQSAITAGTSANTKVLIAEVVNADSVALARGTVVYAFGSIGNKLSVKRADNTSDTTSARTLGFVRDTSLAPNAQGTVTVYGSMDQLSLGSPFVDGDPIFLGTNGGYTKTPPTAPNHSVFLGIVERANAGNGIAYVKVQNGYELDELHDVLITSPLAGQALVRNTANTLWINSGMPPFTLSAGTGSNNLLGAAGTVNWFNGQGASFSTNANGSSRSIPISETCTLKKVVIVIQQSTGSVVGTAGIAGIRNITTGVNYQLLPAATSITTIPDDNYYAYTNSSLSIPFTAGDRFSYYFSSFTVQPTNIRAMVTSYFYL